MILIINTCKEEMHYYEFVKPIEDIIKKTGKEFKVIKIDDVKEKEFKKSEKIIITGTSLRDFNYESEDFSWIKKYDKPMLGICAGMQIICKEFGCELGHETEIGFHDIIFKKDFLGINENETIKAYCLHNSIVKYSKDLKLAFDIYSKNDYIQAIKHKYKQIYCTLFHPEVRNKKIIENFLNIKTK